METQRCRTGVHMCISSVMYLLQGSSQKKIKEGGGFEINAYLRFSDHIKEILPQKGGGRGGPLSHFG